MDKKFKYNVGDVVWFGQERTVISRLTPENNTRWSQVCYLLSGLGMPILEHQILPLNLELEKI